MRKKYIAPELIYSEYVPDTGITITRSIGGGGGIVERATVYYCYCVDNSIQPDPARSWIVSTERWGCLDYVAPDGTKTPDGLSFQPAIHVPADPSYYFNYGEACGDTIYSALGVDTCKNE